MSSVSIMVDWSLRNARNSRAECILFGHRFKVRESELHAVDKTFTKLIIIFIIWSQRRHTIGSICSDERIHREWTDLFLKLWQPKGQRNGESLHNMQSLELFISISISGVQFKCCCHILLVAVAQTSAHRRRRHKGKPRRVRRIFSSETPG